MNISTSSATAPFYSGSVATEGGSIAWATQSPVAESLIEKALADATSAGSPITRSLVEKAIGDATRVAGAQSMPDPAYQPMPALTRCSVAPDLIRAPDSGYAPTLEATLTPGATSTVDAIANGVDEVAAGVGGTSFAIAPTIASTTTSAKELAFLSDKSLSIEEKLFRYMVLMIQKADQQLTDQIKEIEGKKTSSKSGSSAASNTLAAPANTLAAPANTLAAPANTLAAPANTLAAPAKADSSEGSGGGGLFGWVGDAVGAVGDAFSGAASVAGDVAGAVGNTLLGGAEGALKELGGPLLAAAVTALGQPELAPYALEIGDFLGGKAADGLDSLFTSDDAVTDETGTDTSVDATGATTNGGNQGIAGTFATATASKSSSTGTTSIDEQLDMFNLQRMVEKRNAMFAALSNSMKSLHDASMTAIQNIR